MRPVDVAARILAFHPVSVLLIRTGQVLLERGLVRIPIRLKFLLCSLHISVDGFRFYLSDRLPLNEVGFFVPGCPRHGATQLNASRMLCNDPQGAQNTLKLARLIG